MASRYNPRYYFRKRYLRKRKAGANRSKFQLYTNRGGYSTLGMSLKNKVYTFRRVYALDNVTVNDLFTNKAYSFTLGALPNSSEFTQLFDMYRIRSVYIKGFFSRANRDVTQGNLDIAGDPIMPLVYDVIDYDDDTALSGLADYEQYQTMKIRQLTGMKAISRKIYPRINTSVNSGGVATLVGNDSNMKWIDCANTGVKYFGWKLGIDGTTEGAGGTWTLGKFTIYAYITLQCKIVR